MWASVQSKQQGNPENTDIMWQDDGWYIFSFLLICIFQKVFFFLTIITYIVVKNTASLVGFFWGRFFFFFLSYLKSAAVGHSGLVGLSLRVVGREVRQGIWPWLQAWNPGVALPAWSQCDSVNHFISLGPSFPTLKWGQHCPLICLTGLLESSGELIKVKRLGKVKCTQWLKQPRISRQLKQQTAGEATQLRYQRHHIQSVPASASLLYKQGILPANFRMQLASLLPSMNSALADTQEAKKQLCDFPRSFPGSQSACH